MIINFILFLNGKKCFQTFDFFKSNIFLDYFCITLSSDLMSNKKVKVKTLCGEGRIYKL